MKRYKKVGIGILAALSLLVILSLFLPSRVQVERSTLINAEATAVYDVISTPKTWKNWSPWFQKDPTMHVQYFGPESGPGAGYSWDSQNDQVAQGKLTVTQVSAYDSVWVSVQSMKGPDAAMFSFAFRPEGKMTRVNWTFEANMSKPFVLGKFLGLMMESFIGPEFESGLTAMKSYVEALPRSEKTIQVACVPFAAAEVLLVPAITCQAAEIPAKLGESYGLISQWIKQNDMKMSGAPFAIYHEYDEKGVVKMEAGIPVVIAKASSDRVKKGSIRGQMVVFADYYGPYEGSSLAHEAILKWVKDKGKIITGSPWEEYVTDPGLEPDSTKWLTKVYYPVK